MKRLFLIVSMLVLSACASPPGATQTEQVINTTATACKNIDAAIVAADASIQSGVLKGKNRETAVKALGAAQAGCVTALASIQAAIASATPAASGATK
ncbi:MAG: hypothetical protein ABIP06_06415 [Pyrinomonadaceae bacterium]